MCYLLIIPIVAFAFGCLATLIGILDRINADPFHNEGRDKCDAFAAPVQPEPVAWTSDWQLSQVATEGWGSVSGKRADWLEAVPLYRAAPVQQAAPSGEGE